MSNIICQYPIMNLIQGNHYPVNHKWILISIVEPGMQVPFFKHEDDFLEMHRFAFWDLEEPKDKYIELITDTQAESIANILLKAKENKLNVMIHCKAGICRSGAIVEAGILIGFKVPKDHQYNRIPNRLVFTKIRRSLSLLYSFEDIPEPDIEWKKKKS